MAFYTVSWLFVIACFAVISVQSYTEDDYPNVDLPGLAVPNLDDLNDISLDVSDDPKPCCFPKAWQGNVTGQAGISGGRGAKFGQHSTMVFVDEDNKRIAGRGSSGRFRNSTGGFIVLFGANNTADLYLFRMEAQKCCHKKLRRAQFRPQCIPANSTLQGSFSLGPASGGLQVQSWEFRGRSSEDNRGSKAFVGGKIVVVPTGCVPVLIQDHGMIRPRPPHPGFEGNEILFEQLDSEESDELDKKRPGPGPRPRPRPGRRGQGFVASVYFSNIEASIKDPSVFTPPSYCNTTSVDDNKLLFEDEGIPDILQRFVSF